MLTQVSRELYKEPVANRKQDLNADLVTCKLTRAFYFSSALLILRTSHLDQVAEDMEHGLGEAAEEREQ